MRFGDIVNQAWNIAMKYKSLWVWGLFAQGLTLASFNPSGTKWQEDAPSWIHSGAIVALVFGAIVIGFIILILHFLATAGLIDSVNRIARGGEYTFGSAMSAAINAFWRFVGLWFLMLFAGIVIVLAIAIPVVLLFLLSKILGVLSLIVAVPVAIVAFFGASQVYALAQRAIVARDCSLGDAVSEGYWLLKTHLAHNVGIFFLNMALSIASGLCMLVVVAIVAVPFVALGLSSKTGLIVAIALGAPLVVAILVVAEGVIGTFLNAIYTLFYFALYEPQPAVAFTEPPTPPTA